MSALDALLDARAEEAYAEALHPRGPHGRWIPKVGEKASYYHELLGRSFDVTVTRSPDARGFMHVRMPQGEPFQGGVRRVKAMMVSNRATGVPVRNPAAPWQVTHFAVTASEEPGTLLGELCEVFNESQHKRGAKGTSQGGKFVAMGSSGTQVQNVQKQVGAKVDGAFGYNTRASVMAYQRAHGLKVDGVVGHQTAAALQGDKGAKHVKVGALTAADRKALGGSSITRAKSHTRRAKSKATPPKPKPPTPRGRASMTSRTAGGIVA